MHKLRYVFLCLFAFAASAAAGSAGASATAATARISATAATAPVSVAAESLQSASHDATASTETCGSVGGSCTSVVLCRHLNGTGTPLGNLDCRTGTICCILD